MNLTSEAISKFSTYKKIETFSLATIQHSMLKAHDMKSKSLSNVLNKSKAPDFAINYLPNCCEGKSLGCVCRDQLPTKVISYLATSQAQHLVDCRLLCEFDSSVCVVDCSESDITTGSVSATSEIITISDGNNVIDSILANFYS